MLKVKLFDQLMGLKVITCHNFYSRVYSYYIFNSFIHVRMHSYKIETD